METLEVKTNLLDKLLGEEPAIKEKSLLKTAFIDKNDTLVIVLLYKNENFKQISKPYNIEIFDKKMSDWVISACHGYEIKTVACDRSSNVVSLIKPLLNEKENVIVLYSDIPLLTSETVDEIVDYFSLSGMNVLKLPRGWIFKTEYIKTAESISGVQMKQFREIDFTTVLNMKDLSAISEVLKQRIFEKHYVNEVIIVDEKSTYIGSDVIIEAGTKIQPNNVIKGLTYIGKNCLIEPFNYINDSIISNNCIIKNSNILKSKITENMVVGPFEIIENKQS